MARLKIRGANGRYISPNPKKSAKKPEPITTRSARAAAEKRSAKARQREETKGQKATLFAQAMGICPRDCEVLTHGPNGDFAETNGPPEEGVPANTVCHCLSLDSSSCKKHPSRKKVRTGHFIACPTKKQPNKRRAVWVPKVLVDKGIIKVKEGVKFRKNFHGGKPL